MTSLDWAGLMRAGLKELRLTPDQFWKLTPAELGLMLGLDSANAPLGRCAFEQLLKTYPDTKGTADG